MASPATSARALGCSHSRPSHDDRSSRLPAVSRPCSRRRRPASRDAIERCDVALRGLAGWSLLDYLGPAGNAAWPQPVDVVHPLLFAIGYALAELWQSWGIRPDAVAGQSLGEITAFCIAGAMTPEQALATMWHRSRLVRRLTGRGRMAMVALPQDRVLAEIAVAGEPIFIAVHRSPDSVVVAGDPAAVGRFIARLEGQGVFCRIVVDDTASHFPLAYEIVNDLTQALSFFTPIPPTIPVYSTVTGARFAEAPRADYWGRNVSEPVLWEETTRALIEDGHDVFVELSPHPSLLSPIEQIAHALNRRVLTVASMFRGKDGQASMLAGAGALYVAGIDVDWQSLSPNGRPVSLPAYAWDRERYWVTDTTQTLSRPAGAASALTGARLLAGERLDSPLDAAQFATSYGGESPPYFADHQVDDSVVVAGASHAVLAVSIGRELFDGQAIAIEDLAFVAPMLIQDGRRLAVHSVVE